jgi:hypothetical protein
MIRLQRAVVNAVQAAQDRVELYIWLQKAVELEHSTIPPYLTAMYSLKPGTNDDVGRLIRSIVIEEILHLTIAGNILIAIGGRPAINTPDFIPTYPGPLPMSIGGADFIVGIEAFSKPLVENVFMRIEEPEDPIPVKTLALAEAVPDFATIGEFYEALKAKLAEFGDGIFTVGPDQQVLRWFPGAELFPIVDVASASRGIDIIVDQGEGTKTDPFQAPGTRRTITSSARSSTAAGSSGPRPASPTRATRSRSIRRACTRCGRTRRPTTTSPARRPAS